MKLLTQEIRKQLPKLYSTEEVKLEDKIAVAKFFHPMGRGTWFACEFDSEDIFFGYVISPLGADCDEWGNFSLSEMESLSVRGMSMERDLYFTPKKMSEAVKPHGVKL